MYKLFRPLIFQTNSELMHESLTLFGEHLGRSKLSTSFLEKINFSRNKILRQKINGIVFENPIGLAAGFDYKARLTRIGPSLGFGFQTIGTITAHPYEGNPRPRLSRLPQMQALLVNKGFKNDGIQKIMGKFEGKKFKTPIGISLGRTNTKVHKDITEAITDIVSAFRYSELSHAPFAYYELNISCPNLMGNIDFYNPKSLRMLLSALKNLDIKKPIFMKMPITLSDSQINKLLDEIVSFPIAGVIFGNLHHDPNYHPGGISGKPTWKRSNELIAFGYKNYGKKLTIIGCGGVFSAEDAYTKIKLGGSLVQLITGLIYEGPFLPAQINRKLPKLLAKDGFKHISEAVGVESV